MLGPNPQIAGSGPRTSGLLNPLLYFVHSYWAKIFHRKIDTKRTLTIYLPCLLIYSFRNRPEKLAFLLVSKARTNSLNLPTMFTPGIRAHGTVAGTKNAGGSYRTKHTWSWIISVGLVTSYLFQVRNCTVSTGPSVFTGLDNVRSEKRTYQTSWKERNPWVETSALKR
jgi:hypothetical protein